MLVWEILRDLLGSALFALAHIFGGSLGAAILTLPVVLRLALLPLNVRVARIQREHGRAIAGLKPEVDRLRRRYSRNPEKLLAEVRRLHARRGVRIGTPPGFAGILLQWPLWLALFLVVRDAASGGGTFLWIRDLASPDPLLALLAAAFTYAGVSVGSAPAQIPTAPVALLLSGATLLFVVRSAAGVGLYWAASGAVSILQGALIRRTATTATAAGSGRAG